ncbi:MAG: hypothetical protein HY289_14095 [Planctomycetes bacterium]|nr:hypothetical protein [Planctomycetota bacterium]
MFSWLNRFAKTSQKQTKHARHTAALAVEALEDRCVPSGAPTVNLTAANTIGMVNGAIFRQADPQPTGTGVIDSFVRIQTANGKATVEQGFNTDARPLQFDEKNSPQFTRSLRLGSVPTVTIGNVAYREFLLDVNEKASAPLVSLDQLRIHLGSTGDLTSLPGAPIYDFDAGSDHWVELNARLTHGSGSGDMFLYVPSRAFGNDPSKYVYLYSRFGDNVAAGSGFEEWAVGAHGAALTTDNTASISGATINNADQTGIAGVPLTLTSADSLGNTITFTTASQGASGAYSFTNLFAGTYTVSAGTVAGFANDSVVVGTVNNVIDGTASGTSAITSIVLHSGDAGVNYDFSLLSTAYTLMVNVNDKTNASYRLIVTDTSTNTVLFDQVLTANTSMTFNLTTGDDYTVTVSSPGNIISPMSAYSFPDVMENEIAAFTITPRS